MSPLVPMVVEETSRGERGFDIYSRPKKVRRRSVVKVKARIIAEDDSTAKSTVRISS